MEDAAPVPLPFLSTVSMKKYICFFLLISLCFYISGCASKALPQSDIPAWDETVPLNYDAAETPSLFDRLSNILSDDKNDYHFRKVRWGFSRERVELAEKGNRVYRRTDNALVYNIRINDVYCKLIYTFKNNKLRTAGYVTDEPVQNAENLIRQAVKKHGMPTEEGDLVWKGVDTVIYADVYTSVEKRTMTKYQYSSGGLLKDVLVKNLAAREKPGKIFYLDGVFAYIDRRFFDQLHEINFPLQELSFYEKQLMGIIQRRGRTIIPGVGTIPN